MAAVGTLNEEALKRKERLKAMRQKQAQSKDEEEDDEDVQEDMEKLPKPTFRSYKPSTESLQSAIKATSLPSDITGSIKEQLEAGKTEHIISEVDLQKLAPRKPDWDLKRDVSKKLEKLEKKTQRAIAELIRERLKASQEDLASMVAVGAEQSRVEAQDED